MKKIKFIALAFAALCLASCMGDGYADPDLTEKVPASPWGNNSLKEQNVITIEQLKSDYKTPINGGSFKLIDKDIMIKGVITGNDISGNLYNEVSLQDETGAILVCINASGLYGYLPVGQEILVNLKGLYIGGYGKQAEIGGIYTNLKTGATSIGKMDRYTWQEHFKSIGEADATKAVAEEFDMTKLGDAAYLEANAGKLMTIKAVKFTNANGKTVWAANDETTNQTLADASTGKMINSNQLVVRTSGYARFANAILPSGPYDITGIFTRYNNVWQILVRNTDDLAEVSLDKSGTEEDPYTVSEALAIINAGTYTSDKVYTTGIICEVNENDVDTGSYGNATYTISEDGKIGEGKTIKVFRGYNIGGEKWTEDTKGTLAVGKKVVIYGALTLYNGTPEINSGNSLISIK